jgi:hypothetical protein
MGADDKKDNNRSSRNSSEVSGEDITPTTAQAGHYKETFASLSNWIKLNIQKNLYKKIRFIYALGSVEIYPYRVEHVVR